MDKLLKISEAAQRLGVNVQTLRNWEKSGKIRPDFVSPGGHRFYHPETIDRISTNLFGLAEAWASAPTDTPISREFHCPTKDVFETRLRALERDLAVLPDLAETLPLIVGVAGEIGNNAFDHNLGNWPDVSGVFFGYDTKKRHVIVADRGRGVLATLSRVKPSLHTAADALQTAFTEVLSGRAPEERGNGLKFVRKVIRRYGWPLLFESGDASLVYDRAKGDLVPGPNPSPIRGTLAFLPFPASKL